ncbi:MAG: ATP-binding protein [Pseudomonadota bacterium]|nr:ATP-binding protein [Pseudomonadota bacterium]
MNDSGEVAETRTGGSRSTLPVVSGVAALGCVLFAAMALGLVPGVTAWAAAAGAVLFAVVAALAWPRDAARRSRDEESVPVPRAAALPEATRVDLDMVAPTVPSLPPEVQHELEELRGALAHAEELFDRFINFAPIGVILADAEGCVVRANQVVGAMAGTHGREIGQDWLDLVDTADRSRAEARARRMQAGETIREALEVRLSGPDGRFARVFTGWIDDDRGERLTTLHLIDATEQRSLEAQFAQSQKMQAIGQLAGGIAHDFNNLLTAMIGFADLLLMRHPPGDPSYADIVHIKQNANRAAALVRQLLAFSRRQTLRPKVLNLTDVLADLSDLLRRLIGEHLNLRIVHDRDLGLVRADQGQMEQVVTNLVVNARDAMTSGGTVSIETRNVHVDKPRAVGDETMPVGDYVEIAVGDTGTGIAPEHISKIFEPFFTTKEVGQGTGLGLSTVYGIVRQTGGYVTVESEPGVGTTFRIMLPRTAGANEAAEGARRRVAVDLTGQGTILLVEDEDAVRMFAARALRNKGYQVLEAESGDQALAIVEAGDKDIDLMVSDVVMPNMDGPTLIRKARQSRPDLRAVFISGYAEEAFRRSLGDDLIDVDFLPKPFSLKDLAAKVKEQLGR